MKKQIEEMAKAIYNLDHCEGYKDDRGCMYAPSCSVCKYGRENKAKQISELLTKHGYRKASEVATEIFAEIDKRLDDITIVMGVLDSLRTFHKTIEKVTATVDELKKKYIQSEDK